jgi:DNA-binding beta-propeller fold protein YncE
MDIRPVSRPDHPGGGRRLRATLPLLSAAGFAVPIALLVLLSSTGAMIASFVPATSASPNSSGLSPQFAVSSDSHGAVLARCSGPYGTYATTEAYDPADGFVYTANSASTEISIVKPLCKVIRGLNPGGPDVELLPTGTAYDPLTKEIVVTGTNDLNGVGILTVLRGTSVVKVVKLGPFACPSLESWDPAEDAILLADACSGGIDVLHLTEVNGVTRAAVILNAFDEGNDPGAVLVADGYVFSAGHNVDVFNERTLLFIGSFAVTGSSAEALAWDPLNDTVVMGNLFFIPNRESVIFLHTDSIKSGKFTYGALPIYFAYGVYGMAYSPATQDIYLSPYLGSNVLEISKSGVVTRVFLGAGAEPAGMVYDPVNHDMYVGTYGELYVIH